MFPPFHPAPGPLGGELPYRDCQMDLTGLEADIQKIAIRRGTVLVREAPPRGSGDVDYRHGGIMKGTKVNVDPIETPEDENGETRQVAALIRMQTKLLQTESTTAFRLMKEMTSGRVDIILVPHSLAQDVLTSAEAEAEGELKFAGRHLKIGGRIHFDRSESYLPAKLGFRAPRRDFDTFTL